MTALRTQSGLMIVEVQDAEARALSRWRRANRADHSLADMLPTFRVDQFTGRLDSIAAQLDTLSRSIPERPTPPAAHQFRIALLATVNDIERVLADARAMSAAWAGLLDELRADYPITSPPPKAHPDHDFDESDLFGPDGMPHAADIMQNGIGDCFFLSTLGAVANQTPDRIEKGIAFDAVTGNFTVTALFDGQQWAPIKVSQQDISDNLQRRGGSAVDDRGHGPLWPAVVETAYARMLGNGNLEAGYARLGQGGSPRAAMEVLTGKRGDIIPGLMFKTGSGTADYAYGEIERALAGGMPVTMTTGLGARPDSLVDLHSYTVESLAKDASGSPVVTVRNPWGQNDDFGIGAPTLSIRISDMADNVALDDFTIGQ